MKEEKKGLSRRSFLKRVGIGAGAAAGAAVTAPFTLPMLKKEAMASQAQLRASLPESDRDLLALLEEHAAAWPKGHYMRRLKDIDFLHLQTGESFLNCAFMRDFRPEGRIVDEVFTITLEHNASPARKNQEITDLGVQVDRFYRMDHGNRAHVTAEHIRRIRREHKRGRHGTWTSREGRKS